MSATDTYSKLIHGMYSAANAQQPWSAFLADYARLVNGGPSALYMHDCGTGGLTQALDEDALLETYDFDPDYLSSYRTHYIQCNPWTRDPSMLQPGRAICSEMLLDTSSLLATPFYQEWLKPQQLQHALGAVVSRQQNQAIILASLRPPKMGRFGAEAIKWQAQIQPHLCLALEMQQKLQLLRNLNSALDALPLALWLCAQNGTVMYSNQAGQRLAQQQRGLWVDRGDTLRSEALADDESLQAAIQRACQARPGAVRSGSVLNLNRPHCATTLNVMVAPISNPPPGVESGTHAIVFASDPDSRFHAPEALLMQRFGLTHRQAQLAGWLMLGEDLKSYARHFDVAYDTARSHLKQIFLKTGARRQSDLMRILLASVPPQAQ